MHPGNFTFQEFLEHDGGAAGVQTDRCLHLHQLEHADSRGRITHWQRHSPYEWTDLPHRSKNRKIRNFPELQLGCRQLVSFTVRTRASAPAVSTPDSSDGVVTRLWTERCKFRCQAMAGNFVFPKTATPRMGPTQHSIQRHQNLSPSSPFSEEANKEWRCTSTPRYGDNFTFGFIYLAISL